MKPPGPEPKRPLPLGPSPDQIRWQNVMKSPLANPATQAVAQQRYGEQEAIRKELDSQRQADYVRDYTNWHQDTREYAKFVREKRDRNIKQLGERLGLEKTQADLEKMYFEQGLPRQQQVQKAALDIAQAQQTLTKRPTHQIEGALYQETPEVPAIPPTPGQPGSPGRPAGALEMVPGSPEPKKTLTEQESKAATFVRDVLPDMDLLETKLNHGMALAKSPWSSLGASVPGMGNIFATDEYKAAANAIGRFKGAVMQHLSGAAVSPSEAERNLPAFIPRYGDNEQEVLRKAERRRNYVNGVAAVAGRGGDAIEAGRKIVMQNNSELPVVRDISPEQAKSTLGAGQRFVLPDGTIGVVPWPKHLLPR